MANPFSFPTGFHLLISTHECVFSWSHESLEPVFRSATNGGILAARQSGDGRGTLAIADSQVVILQNVNTGTNREYKLEGEEVRTQSSYRFYSKVFASRATSAFYSIRATRAYFSSHAPSVRQYKPIQSPGRAPSSQRIRIPRLQASWLRRKAQTCEVQTCFS